MGPKELKFLGRALNLVNVFACAVDARLSQVVWGKQ